MPSEFQIRKLTHLFNVQDLNGDGSLQWDDFRRQAVRMCEKQRVSLDSPTFAGIQRKLRVCWQELADWADSNRDGSIQLEEFIGFYGMLIDTSMGTTLRRPPTWLGSLAEDLFDLCDLDGNGHISLAEFQVFLSAYGADDAQAAGVFATLDRDNNGNLDREEAKLIAWEFFIGTDPDEPGNYIFGNFA
jgi:Ca2+-binding EF-hand superfamily protein